MGLFGGGPSRRDMKKMINAIEKTERKISIRCQRCGKVYNQTVYGNGRVQVQCKCGYNLTERDRY